MALQSTVRFRCSLRPTPTSRPNSTCSTTESFSLSCFSHKSRFWRGHCRRIGVKTFGLVEELRKKMMQAEIDNDEDDGDNDDDADDDDLSSSKRVEPDDVYLADDEERREWREKIREVISKYPNVGEDDDPVEKRKRMQKLLADYPLVVDEEDPDWPEDADGRGFNLDQFFDKITIKNAKKNDEADEDKYDSEDEIVWQDDNYIRPIKDIKAAEWEETVFKDISPLIILVHNRYKRPKENETFRNELEKAVHIIWNCRLPSPRCVAIDAVIEDDLVSALNVPIFPELIFTKAGKILYREKAARTADDLSKIMAFFYYGGAKPPCLSSCGDGQELIPSFSVNDTSSCE